MNYAKSPLPVLYKQNNKAWMMAHVLTTWPLNILSPLLRPTAQKKKIPFRMLLLIDNTPGYPRALIGMYDVIVFMLPTKHPF